MNKIETEKKIVEKMIKIYCRGNKHLTPCDDCINLVKYAHDKLEGCKFKENKSFCSKCSVHCYRTDMRAKIKKVMKYSGPRMLIYSPIMAFKHILQSSKNKSI